MAARKIFGTDGVRGTANQGNMTPEMAMRLGMAAARLERLQEPVRTVSLIQFQSAVAVLSRLRLAGAPAALINAHIEALSSLPVTEQGYEGGVARWIGDRVFTESGEAAPSDPMLYSLGGGPWRPHRRALDSTA